MKAKELLKENEELWDKNRNIIKTSNSGNYDGEYRKIKFNSYGYLPLNKTLKSYNLVTVVRYVFHEGKKYYP